MKTNNVQHAFKYQFYCQKKVQIYNSLAIAKDGTKFSHKHFFSSFVYFISVLHAVWFIYWNTVSPLLFLLHPVKWLVWTTPTRFVITMSVRTDHDDPCDLDSSNDATHVTLKHGVSGVVSFFETAGFFDTSQNACCFSLFSSSLALWWAWLRSVGVKFKVQLLLILVLERIFSMLHCFRS